jgi:hypothetical protein
MNTQQPETLLEALEPITAEMIDLRQDLKLEMGEMRGSLSHQFHLHESLQKELSKFINITENYSPVQGQRVVQELKNIAEKINLKTEKIQTSFPGEKISSMNIKLEKLEAVVAQLRQEIRQQGALLADFPNWKLVISTTIILSFLGLILLYASHSMTKTDNSILEDKLDQISARNEQIWKKMKK